MRIAKLVLLGLAAAALLPDRPLAAAQRPDLRVAVQLQKVQKQGKWFVNMRFTVSNVGTAPAPQSVLGAWCMALAGGPCPGIVPKPDYRVGPPVVGGATGAVHLTTPALMPGASVFVLGPDTLEWPNGGYTITARADLPNHIIEPNEANNEATAGIAIP